MKSLNDYINEYQKQLNLGDIKIAYKGLMNFLNDLRIHFKNDYPEFYVSNGIYQGYMDISFFSFTPNALKKDRLKVALLLNHEELRFEIWLCGNNKQVQSKYWKIFKGSDFTKYRIADTAQHSVMEHILVENPNFNDLESLTKQIESSTLEFVNDIVEILK